MAEDFYPFVEQDREGGPLAGGAPAPSDVDAIHDQLLHGVRYPARIAVFDDAEAAPRVVVVEPQPVRSYLEEVTATVTRLSHEQGGAIPFTVIREVVENLVHAYFMEPTISILAGGSTIRFSDQGPGIKEKDRALQFGTTSATDDMKRFIRGVGSGLPYAQQYLRDRGGSLTIEDNIHAGTIVTISLGEPERTAPVDAAAMPPAPAPAPAVAMAPAAELPQPAGEQVTPAQPAPAYPQASPAYPQPAPAYPQAAGTYPPATYPGAPQVAPGYPTQTAPQQPAYPGVPAQMPGYPAMPAAPNPYQPYPAYPGYPAGQPAYPGYPYQPAPAPMPAPMPGAQATGEIILEPWGRDVLAYLGQHESVGSTELVGVFGSSAPTWTRRLKQLEDMGLVAKRGQKRYLTDAGRAFLSQLR